MRATQAQPTLPGEFQPPPPECPVSGGKHYWQTIKSYSKILYYPVSAYQEYCTYCSVSKKGVT